MKRRKRKQRVAAYKVGIASRWCDGCHNWLLDVDSFWRGATDTRCRMCEVDDVIGLYKKSGR